MALISFFLSHFTEHNALLSHWLCHMGQNFIFPLWWITFHYEHTEYILYSSVVGMSHILASVSAATANMSMQ